MWEGLVEDAIQWVTYGSSQFRCKIVASQRGKWERIVPRVACLVSDSSRSFSFADSLQGEGALNCFFLEAACDGKPCRNGELAEIQIA